MARTLGLPLTLVALLLGGYLFTQQSKIVDRNPWPANYSGFGRFTARTGAPITASPALRRYATAASRSST